MTTIFYPDLSGFDKSVHVEPNTTIVVARATLSTSIADTEYLRFKQEAAQQGAFFAAYHWMNHGNTVKQAAWVYAHVGSVPLMLDVEDVAGNTGFSGSVTIDDVLGFLTAYRAMGGVCYLAYLPRWYWSDHMGSPDLTPLGNAGLHLVSSAYAAYSDTGLGWQPYGGLTPVAWQYTDQLLYSTGLVDFNAFKGTVQDFIELATGENIMLTDDDIARIKAAICGGNDALTMDNLQQWLGDGVDGRTNPPTPIGNRPNLNALISAVAKLQSTVDDIRDHLDTTASGTIHVTGDLTVS